MQKDQVHEDMLVMGLEEVDARDRERWLRVVGSNSLVTNDHRQQVFKYSK